MGDAGADRRMEDGTKTTEHAKPARRLPRRRPLHKRIRDSLARGLVASMLGVARIAPIALTVRLGEWLAVVLSRFDRRHRAVAFRNLERAFGSELDAAARRRIVDGVYRHFGRLLAEYALLLAKPALLPASQRIQLEGVAAAQAAVRSHGAIIIVTLHQGHWELLGGAISEQVAKLHAVVLPLRDPVLNERLVDLRQRLGMGLIERENAVAALFRCLRRGLSVGLLCDLDQEESPAFIEFFGTPAATVRTPAVLALRTGKPLVLTGSWSTARPLDYHGVLMPPLFPDLAADPAVEEHRLLTAMNRQYEAFIRAHPEQWNWIHPRWETRPAGEPNR